MSHVTNRQALIAFPLLKGGIVATTTINVIQSDLGAFTKTLIIAVVSSLVGAMGMIISAVIATRATQEVKEAQKENTKRLEDLKGAVGAAKRKEDTDGKPAPKD